MLGFGALGQLALGQAGGIRQDLVDIQTETVENNGGNSRRRRRYDDELRKAYERRERVRRRAKLDWHKKAAEWRRDQERRRARAQEHRREQARLEAIRLEQERQRLLGEALLAIADAARQAELAAHIAAIDAQLQELYLQSLDDDAIAVLLLAA